MTLGNAAAARVRPIVWCKECRYQVEPDPAEARPAIRRGDARPRMACAARLFAMRRPGDRYGRDG
jgi:hypothetical protein